MKPSTRKITWSVALFTVLLAIVFSLPACSRKQQESKEVKVGLCGPFSGPAANWGEQFKRGIELAFSEIDKVDVDRIKLVYEDSEAEPRKAVLAFQKLISVDNVKIIIGPLSSTEVLSVAPIAEKSKIIMLTPTAPHKDITLAGDYVFRIYPSDEKRSVILADYTYNDLHAKSIGIIYRKDDFGTAVQEAYVQRLIDLGINNDSICNEGYEPGLTDFRTIILKVKAKAPSVVLLVGHSKELGFMVRQSYELGFKPQFLSTADFENPEVLRVAGEAANGVIYGSIVFDVNSPDPLIRTFRKRYQEFFKTEEEPGLVVALSYDAFQVIYDAIKRSEFGSIELIKNSLYKTKNFPGVTGNITFDENGDVTKSWGLKIVKNGKFEVLKQVY